MKGLKAIWHVLGDRANTLNVIIVSDPISPISYDHCTDSEILDLRLDDELYVVVLPLNSNNSVPQPAPISHLHMRTLHSGDDTRKEMGLEAI